MSQRQGVLHYELDFEDVVNVIVEFIAPPYEAIIGADEFLENWSYKEREYI